MNGQHWTQWATLNSGVARLSGLRGKTLSPEAGVFLKIDAQILAYFGANM